MNDISNHDAAVGLLQELGLKEYEAKAFVALSRLPRGTAKEISEISEVPRTRVYDAIRVLESKGLVETQHSNPQQFRAVDVDEAVETLRREYEERTESLRKTLTGLEPADLEGSKEVTHEVWALTGTTAIENRTEQLVEEATEELVVVLGHEAVFTEELVAVIREAEEKGVQVVVGTIDEGLQETVQEVLPDIDVYVSGLDWLTHAPIPGDDTEIGRLLLVDRSTILVSSFVEDEETARRTENGVFGRGFDNGLVAIVRRLMATGMPGEMAADD